MASIHGVNTVLTSKLSSNPLLGGPMHTGQCRQLSNGAIWASNSGILCIQSVVQRRQVLRVVAPIGHEDSSPGGKIVGPRHPTVLGKDATDMKESNMVQVTFQIFIEYKSSLFSLIPSC